MEEPSPHQKIDETQQEITARLIAWNSGDTAALDDVIHAVYKELRRMADRYLRMEHPGHSLQPTALVHEAYLRLIDQTQVNWQNRAHFFGVAAQMMRRILVDHARTKQRDKRGGPARTLSLDEVLDVGKGRAADLVALDEALESLTGIDPRKGRVVEMRFFGGLSVEETAAVLDVSPQTVMRDWKLAKAWLYQEIKRETRDEA
ncbi:MAG: sigma-70 family RNA polymerase sigma factor [Pyrinomonadaceae bacterium]|nr:sigma-70 family RNA polymerase sigma factor [Pyrinomonadaceae bacterium]